MHIHNTLAWLAYVQNTESEWRKSWKKEEEENNTHNKTILKSQQQNNLYIVFGFSTFIYHSHIYLWIFLCLIYIWLEWVSYFFSFFENLCCFFFFIKFSLFVFFRAFYFIFCVTFCSLLCWLALNTFFQLFSLPLLLLLLLILVYRKCNLITSIRVQRRAK